MRINSVQSQNHNKKPINFGCDYCRLTKEVLAEHGFKGHEVEAILLKVNPKDLGAKVVSMLKGSQLTPDKIHTGRAEMIYESFAELTRKQKEIFEPGVGLKDALLPDGLEKLIKIMREEFDDSLALRTGNDFNLYV